MASDYSGPDEFGVDVIYLLGGASVALSGELDVATAPVLLEYLTEFVSQNRIDITVDISDVSFMEYTGLSVFLMAQRRLELLGGSLMVRHPRESVRQLFQLTGLAALLQDADAPHLSNAGDLAHV
jgi:anti-sigma B factor antagonist